MHGGSALCTSSSRAMLNTRTRHSWAVHSLAVPALFCCCQLELLLAQQTRSTPHRPHLLPGRRALRNVSHDDLIVREPSRRVATQLSSS